VSFNGEFWEGTNTASNVTADNTLTLEKLQAVMRSIPTLPPAPKYDLYGSLGLDGAYEINLDAVGLDFLRPPGTEGRKTLVVPKDQLDVWYDTLRKAGADVRLEPRLAPADASAGAPHD
jgi:hypothetical protein